MGWDDFVKDAWDGVKDVAIGGLLGAGVGGNVAGTITGATTGAILGAASGDEPASTPTSGGEGAPEGLDFERLIELSRASGIAQIRESEAAANRMIEANIDRFPHLSNVAVKASTKAAGTINQFMRDALEESLDWLYPEWRTEMVGAAIEAQGDSVKLTQRFREEVLPEVLDRAAALGSQALSNVSDWMAGRVSDATASELGRRSAEVAAFIGSRGEAPQFATARDLGMFSEQLQQQALALAPQALGLTAQGYAIANQTLQMPVQTGTAVTNLLSAYRPGLVDVGSLYAGALGQITGVAAVNPNTAYQTTAQIQSSAAQLGANIGMFQQELASQEYWNQQNMQMAQSMFQQQLGAQKDAMQYQLLGSVIGLGSSIGVAGLL